MAFLTIITRSFRRPESLGRCVNSVALQTDPDVEQVVVFDPIGRGVEMSYLNLKSVVPSGEYVMLLDDDDYLIDPSFVWQLKQVTKDEWPDVVFVGMDVNGNILPDWEHGLRRGFIACSCFAIKHDVWIEHAQNFKADYSADFYFIEDVMNCAMNHTSIKLDLVASKVGKVSHGQPENIAAFA